MTMGKKTVRNVFFGSRSPVSFRQTEINDINYIGSCAQTEDKVVGFDVTMDKITMVDELQTR